MGALRSNRREAWPRSGHGERMSLFLRLLLAHMLGDFVLQPLRLVLMKRRGWLGVLAHVAIVVVVSALLLWPVVYHPWYCLCLLSLALCHAMIDGGRVLHRVNSERRGLLILFVDQALHIGVLTALAALTHVAQARYPDIPVLAGSSQADSLIVHLMALTFLLWTVPVLELEARNALALGGRRLAIAASDRWLGALERVGGVALVLVGCVYLAPLPFVPRILLQMEGWKDPAMRPYLVVQTAISFCAGLVTALVLIEAPVPLL
jgi:hypothetical protein